MTRNAELHNKIANRANKLKKEAAYKVTCLKYELEYQQRIYEKCIAILNCDEHEWVAKDTGTVVNVVVCTKCGAEDAY